jgi:hypothetical protein
MIILEVYKHLKSQITGGEIEDEIGNFEYIENRENVHLNDDNYSKKKNKKKCC